MAHSTAQGSTKAASVVLRFEAGDLFIQAVVNGFKSMNDAQEFISLGPRITVENDWLYVRCPIGNTLALYRDEDTADECGRWIKGADQNSLDDFLESLLSIPEFLQHVPVTTDFVLNWFAITEWSLDEKGRPSKLLDSTSHYIDKFAQDEQRLSIYQPVP